MLIIIGTYIILEKKSAATFFDVALFFVPFFLWYGLALTGLRPKSLANLVEPFAFAPIIAISLLVRSFVFKKISNVERSRIAFFVVILIATAIYFLVPALPE